MVGRKGKRFGKGVEQFRKRGKGCSRRKEKEEGAKDKEEDREEGGSAEVWVECEERIEGEAGGKGKKDQPVR
jgi:hypothetical protein